MRTSHHRIKTIFIISCLFVSGLFGTPLVISQANDQTLNNASQIARQLCEFYYASPAFQVKLDTIERKKLFKQGDQLGFVFSATQDAYFMILSIDPLYNMSIIYPYTASEIKKIAAHTPYKLANAGIV